MSEVTLYARPVLERIRAEIPFELVERDIETDEAWQRAYFERIPVVVLDGRELFDYRVDEAELRRRLTAASSGAGVTQRFPRRSEAAGDELQSER
jgi:Glutaredoxin-like domain (DUF836)